MKRNTITESKKTFSVFAEDELSSYYNYEIACMLGLDEAIVLQQVHEWLMSNVDNESYNRDGRVWVKKSFSGLSHEIFGFWSTYKVERLIKGLVHEGYLIKANYSMRDMDSTNWYTIDYDKIYQLFDDSNIFVGTDEELSELF